MMRIVLGLRLHLVGAHGDGVPARLRHHAIRQLTDANAMSERRWTTPESMSADWGITPAAIAWPGRTDGLSAVVFAGHAARRVEVSSPSDPATHILAISTLGHHATFAVDGREVHEGRFEVGAIQLVQAGETPAAMLTGDWRVIHIYLPAGDLRQLAEDLGLSTADARALAFIIPYFAREPVLGRIGRRLDQRLSRGDAPSRLELDDLFLTIGCRLIRSHASKKPPRRPRPPALSGPECRRLLTLLGDAQDPGLDDLARQLDRSGTEVERAFRETFHAAPHEIRGSLRRGRWP
jgi:hypothetical protein